MWDRLTDLFLFRMHSSISSFFSYPQTLSFARTSCSQAHWELFPALLYRSQQLNLPQRCSHTHPKNPTEDVFGKISREGIWGREQSHSQAGLSTLAAAWESFPEQPHPGSPNLMAGFQRSSQDWEGERLERGERKQGNASEVRRGLLVFFSGRGRLVLFACLQRCHFPEAGALTKNGKFLFV